MLLVSQSDDLYLSDQNDPLIHAKDPIVLLTIKIYAANINNLGQFFGSMQFDVEELETYIKAMQDPNTTQWAKAMEEKLDQPQKNNT